MTKELGIKECESSSFVDFDCGDEKLNTFLFRYARQNDEKGVGKTFVLLEEGHIVAFYTLSSAQIGFEELPTSIAKGLPRYPIPAIRIARLAVSKKWQRKGYGALALKYAFRRILSVSPHVGIAFILVDAKDSARGFYERFGFVEIDSEKRTYAIPLGTVLKALIQ